MLTNSLVTNKKKPTALEPLLGLLTVVLSAALIAALYFGRALLIPLAMAALLTFMLSPLVAAIQRWTGRVAAVTSVTVLVFCGLVSMSWVISRQALDLVSQLPNYRSNIERKLHSLELSKEGPVTRFAKMVTDIESEVLAFGETTTPPDSGSGATSSAGNVRVAESHLTPVPNHFDRLQFLVVSFAGMLGTCGIVTVLVIFMLLDREEMQGRIVKLIGHGRISFTTRAMEDAAHRVSRYLITQLGVNIAFGMMVGTGLYIIGVPNAFLWGALGAVLRFIPYIGAWLAALPPLVLALAVSPGWQMLSLTLGLFVVLELVTGNFIEPLIYRSSTGVSSFALVVAALFWTWLWGPAGLLVSTPLTVCLAVLGRHVPRLSFFSTLLASEEPFTPAEECYHRLLVGGLNDAEKTISAYARTNSLTALYDNVAMPVVILAETDFYRGELEEYQHARVLHGIRDIVGDLSSRSQAAFSIESERSAQAETKAALLKADCRVVCASSYAERDALASAMLVHLLQVQGFDATTADHSLSLENLTSLIETYEADAVCVSVVAPTPFIHARKICAKLRAKFKTLKIIVGYWGATETLEPEFKSLQASGVDEVVISFASAVVQLGKFSALLLEQAVPAKIPNDEDVRIAALTGLEAYAAKANPLFDRMTKTVTRTFNVQVALITLIDRDRQLFKSQFGLPDELAQVCEIPRRDSVCTYVVADNAPLVVEDLWRDRRFSKNPMIKKYGFHFYAGTPLHAANGQPVGALCILDTQPRRFSEADKALLKVLGEEISSMLLPANQNDSAMKSALAV